MISRMPAGQVSILSAENGKTTIQSGALVQGNADQAGLANIGILLQRGALDAVSYTHLDVYKRQIHGSPPACTRPRCIWMPMNS